MNLSKEKLLDKMRGGWYGKNIGGTLGGPLEGRMELMEISFYTQEFDGPLPNDDLDLQLINLHCLEQYGARITSEHIGKEWAAHVFFQYDEYGHALTNLRRGITLPFAGCYNNYFTDCMGSPIRSEIWGMVTAGNPDLAAYYALQDACVDHAGGEGVYGEIFFAVLESLAFIESDVRVLIKKALSYIPEGCETAKAVCDLLTYFEMGMAWQEAREKILKSYGTPNFTYAPPNIAFTILGLMYGKDFSDAICIACNCGYDTDCTVATLGSILGIIGGMEVISQKWIDPIGDTIKVSKEVNGFRAPENLEELTERTYRMYKLVQAEWDTILDRSAFALNYSFQQYRRLLPEGSFTEGDLAVTMSFSDGHPAIGSKEKTVIVTVKNVMRVCYNGSISLNLPQELTCMEKYDFSLDSGEEKEFIFNISGAVLKSYWYECMLCIKRYSRETLWTVYNIPFTLVPVTQWKVRFEAEQPVLLESPTAGINFAEVFQKAEKGCYTAETIVEIPRERQVELIAATTAPVTCKVDGEVLFQSAEETPFIPAYHRSAAQKRASLNLTAGPHKVEISVEHCGGAFPEVAFYVVEPKGTGSFSHFIDINKIEL